MIRYPIGISTFRELTTGNYIFVDKTLFLKDFIEEGSKVSLITRPRRFGKTLTLSMCEEFFDIENTKKDNIFTNLKISKHKDLCEESQNKYPVIFVSFKDVKEPNFDKAIEQIGVLLRGLYKNNKDLLKENFLDEDEKEYFHSIINEKASQTQMQGAVKYLSLLLHKKYNKKPILLIDEYDTPIQAAYLEGYYQDMVNFMRGFFGTSLKEMGQSKEMHFHKALVTGISHIAKESLFSDLNNFASYTMLDEEYGEYFGFTEDEVIELLDKTKSDAKLEDIKSWYNGYYIGGHTIYNAWSIINCLSKNGKLQNYWINTGGYSLIYKLLDNAQFNYESDFESLLQNQEIEVPLLSNTVFPDLEYKENAIWSLLVHTGYLNVLEYSQNKMAKVKVPNREVMDIYKDSFSNRFTINVSVARYNSFYNSLIKADFEKFREMLQFYLSASVSYFDFNKYSPENVFHSFMLGILVGISDNYHIISNRESGKGRLDVAIVPRDASKAGIVLEFKISDSENNMRIKAKEALDQIKEKNYISIFKEHGVGEVHALGFGFYGKEVEMLHEKL